MKYLRKFDTYPEYTKEKSNLSYPNVSLIEDDSYCCYNKVSNTNFGDIVLFDKITDKFIYISPEAYKESYWKDLTKEPIGVVAVPTLYTPDGSTRVCSLVNMSLKTPESGTAVTTPVEGDNRICWGGKDIDLPLSNLTKINKVNPSTGDLIGTENWTRLPSDEKFNNTGYIDYLSGCYYSFNSGNDFGPYSVLLNGEKNPLYYAEGMATNDFNGPSNTDTIVGAAEGSPFTNWKTTSTITNSYEQGSYPAAFCCRRFHTPGTNAGDWYLPAIGELAFLSTHYGKINSGLLYINEKLNSLYSINISRLNNDWYWSSTTYNNNVSWSIYTMHGSIDSIYRNKTLSGIVRAYLKLY